ncbi:MAG TPA: hypothetical protein DIC52_12580 [Candidatus Latescibacteria bacterium]|nr:hypothetical protein [Candidatus Latescibacterota bacterium]
MIIEAVSGRPLAHEFRDRLLTPHGLGVMHRPTALGMISAQYLLPSARAMPISIG